MQHVAQRTSRSEEALACNGGYRVHLGTCELISEVRRLLTIQRHTEHLICRYLADLADRILERQDAELEGYVDELHAARCFFQLGVRDTRERVRIGRALRQLPEIERALREGKVSYSRVREVTRVATSDTEHEWLSLAERLDMRSLERRVVVARGLGSRTAKTLRVTFELSPEAWALLERSLAGARRLSGEPLSESEAIEAVARYAIAGQNAPPDASDRYLDVLGASGPVLVDGHDDATQGGSPAGHLLQIMGHRGGWTTDALVESSGLSASAVSSTLLVLELEGKVKSHELVFERCEQAAS